MVSVYPVNLSILIVLAQTNLSLNTRLYSSFLAGPFDYSLSLRERVRVRASTPIA